MNQSVCVVGKRLCFVLSVMVRILCLLLRPRVSCVRMKRQDDLISLDDPTFGWDGAVEGQNCEDREGYLPHAKHNFWKFSVSLISPLCAPCFRRQLPLRSFPQQIETENTYQRAQPFSESTCCYNCCAPCPCNSERCATTVATSGLSRLGRIDLLLVCAFFAVFLFPFSLFPFLAFLDVVLLCWACCAFC